MVSSSRLPFFEAAKLRSYVITGIPLRFSGALPPPRHYNNTHSVRLNSSFVATRLDKYECIDAVEDSPDPNPDYIQPLHVIIGKPPKKPRNVLDRARNLNDFLEDEPLVYESVDTAVRQMQPGDWMGKLDIKDCFLSWLMDPAARPFLTFKFGSRLLRFKRMVFGLKSAPAVCTQLLSVVSFALLEAGIRHARLLDDFLIIASSRDTCIAAMHKAMTIFHSFGLLLSQAKIEGPSQRLTFLGILIDSVTCTLECSPERQVELFSLIDSFLGRHTARARELLSLAGKFSFASIVMPASRPFNRLMFDLANSAPLDFYVTLSSSFKTDLRLWRELFHLFNGKCKWRQPFSIAASSDASRGGFSFAVHSFGGYHVTHLADLPFPIVVCTGLFSSADLLALVDPHIAVQWAELFSIFAALAWGGTTMWAGARILYFTDNESNVGSINRFSTSSLVLRPLLRAIALLCVSFNVHIHACHVAGVDNSLCDFHSRPELHHFSVPVSSHDLHHLSDCCVTPTADSSTYLFLTSEKVRSLALAWPMPWPLSSAASAMLVPPTPTSATRRPMPSSSASVSNSSSTATSSPPTFKQPFFASGSASNILFSRSTRSSPRCRTGFDRLMARRRWCAARRSATAIASAATCSRK
jgi:hypothetical protein